MRELFSEIYGCYYAVVADILNQAKEHGLTAQEIDRIVEQKAFSESCFHLIPRLMDGQWNLLEERTGRYWSRLAHKKTQRPVSLLEKSWLKALLSDRRIRLFFTEEEFSRLSCHLKDVEPLFDWQDFYCFDQSLDGDPYENARYRHHFRMAFSALQERKSLWVHYSGGKGGASMVEVLPLQMSYSDKDDKFRLLCVQRWGGERIRQMVLNVARIQAVRPSGWQAPPLVFSEYWKSREERAEVVFLIHQERNALERAMLQFASYQKTTVFLEEQGSYLCRLQYDMTEETELVIRLLSFGPLVEVLKPQRFRQEISRRIKEQIKLMESPL